MEDRISNVPSITDIIESTFPIEVYFSKESHFTENDPFFRGDAAFSVINDRTFSHTTSAKNASFTVAFATVELFFFPGAALQIRQCAADKRGWLSCSNSEKRLLDVSEYVIYHQLEEPVFSFFLPVFCGDGFT